MFSQRPKSGYQPVTWGRRCTRTTARAPRASGPRASGEKNGAWYGEFVANSGTDTDTLPNVKYAGAPSTVQAGTTLPALDTGAGDEVYPPTGSGEWIHVVLGLVVCTVVLSALLTKGLFVVRRRVRARRADYLTEEADSLS